MALRERIDLHVRVPVPPPKTSEWRRWEDEWRAIGQEAAPMLVEVLEHGTENEQYSALLALRLFGYEAWADGYGPDLIYRVSEPGRTEVRIIKPRITPEPYEPIP